MNHTKRQYTKMKKKSLFHTQNNTVSYNSTTEQAFSAAVKIKTVKQHDLSKSKYLIKVFKSKSTISTSMPEPEVQNFFSRLGRRSHEAYKVNPLKVERNNFDSTQISSLKRIPPIKQPKKPRFAKTLENALTSSESFDLFKHDSTTGKKKTFDKPKILDKPKIIQNKKTPDHDKTTQKEKKPTQKPQKPQKPKKAPKIQIVVKKNKKKTVDPESKGLSLPMPELPTLEDLVKEWVHCGHGPKRWNAQMEPFLYGQKKSFHFIDLVKTRIYLIEVCKFLIDQTAKEIGRASCRERV